MKQPDIVQVRRRSDAALRRSCPARSQRGQVTVLLVLSASAFILLIAFIVNTAQVISRKIELQGAADASAIAGALWVARGMNIIASNNKGMADLLSIMIVVRALRETAPEMSTTATAMAASLTACAPYCTPLAIQLAREAAWWTGVAAYARQVDTYLNEPSALGWTTLRLIDKLNQGVKGSVIPIVAPLEAAKAARHNGADSAKIVGRNLFMYPPMGRGGKETIARQAAGCCLPKLLEPVVKGLVVACGLCITPFLSGIPLKFHMDENVANLSGGTTGPLGGISAREIENAEDPTGQTVGDKIDEYLNEVDDDGRRKHPKVSAPKFRAVSFKSGEALSWPSDPPYPMLLSDAAERAGDWRLPDPDDPDPERSMDFAGVRRKLQFMALAQAPKTTPLFASERYDNTAWLGSWYTYAQTEVYNARRWSGYDQHWQARLARATLVGDLAQYLSLSKSADKSLPNAVNAH